MESEDGMKEEDDDVASAVCAEAGKSWAIKPGDSQNQWKCSVCLASNPKVTKQCMAYESANPNEHQWRRTKKRNNNVIML